MGQTLSRMELETSKRGIQDHPARRSEAVVNGPESLAAFTQANNLVKLNRYAEALAVEMLPSDRELIERRIKESVAAGANSTKERNE